MLPVLARDAFFIHSRPGRVFLLVSYNHQKILAMLSILRKARLKDKEMRILML